MMLQNQAVPHTMRIFRGREIAAAALLLAVTVDLPAQSQFPIEADADRRERIASINKQYGIKPTPDNVLQTTFFPERLNLPTYVTRVGDTWFIVDCYNNRIVYSDRLELQISDWQVLDDQLSRPHSLASDGEYYLVDDTDAHALNVYRRSGDEFELWQVITDVGARPHRVVYDDATGAFYALASESQEIVKLVAGEDSVSVAYRKHLPDLNQAYTRSFQFIDGKMYLASGPGYITVLEYQDNSYQLLGKYFLPARLHGMNDLTRAGDKWYVNATLNITLECDSLAKLEKDDCRSVYDDWQLTGNPYYFSVFGDRYFITQVAGGDNVIELGLEDGRLRYKKEYPEVSRN